MSFPPYQASYCSPPPPHPSTHYNPGSCLTDRSHCTEAWFHGYLLQADFNSWILAQRDGCFWPRVVHICAPQRLFHVPSLKPLFKKNGMWWSYFSCIKEKCGWRPKKKDWTKEQISRFLCFVCSTKKYLGFNKLCP